jgi:hypothetical protein
MFCSRNQELQKERKNMSQPENQFGDQPSLENQPPAAPVYAAPIVPQQDIPTEPARMGAGARLINTIFSPGETFADVNRKPDWIVPLIIMVLIAASTSFFINWRLNPDMDKLTRDRIRKQVDRFGGQMPPEEQIQKQVEIAKVVNKFTPVIGAVGVGIWFLVLSGIYALGLILIQAKATFKKILSVVLWSSAATGIIYTVVFMASLMVKDEDSLRSIDLNNPTATVPTNIGAFLDSSTSPVIRSLAGSIDVFSIWSIILLSIGFAAIANSRKIKPSKTATVVIGVWVIGVLLKAVFASFFG